MFFFKFIYFPAIDESQLGKRGYLTPMTAKEYILALWKNEGNGC